MEVESYKHKDAKRKNIPPAKIAGEGVIPQVKKVKYAYSPHLTPVLRIDYEGGADELAEIVEKAIQGNSLSAKESVILRAVAKNAEQPWLEWAGKKAEHDRKNLEVDPVALHIHERVSAQAIVRAAMREDAQRSLFADPEQDYNEALQFYKHDIDWANRMILGDSLQVMSSLARREDLAGKVQMIYIDPPYGIKFASNFQSEVGKRNVKDKDSDLTREPEMVKAYRDTWHLGIHSYLTYLRDRLIVCRELLSDSGSIFVQIGDENIHRVRSLMDEVFGPDNFISQITFQTTSGFETNTIASIGDFLLWYSKNQNEIKVHSLYEDQPCIPGEGNAKWILFPDRSYRGVSSEERKDPSLILDDIVLYNPGDLQSQGAASTPQPYIFNGRKYLPKSNNHWKPNYPFGLDRLAGADRIHVAANSIRYRRLSDDFPLIARGNVWTDTLTGSFTEGKVYVVQTNTKVIERCILLTTDPGDLVLDPTCGSGTTALVAEKWGRRWITADTSRVAISIARQRLLTARFERYRINGELDHETKNGTGVDPSANFVYRTVPHIRLGDIARNIELDPIIEKHKKILDDRLHDCNLALRNVNDDLREKLVEKLANKMQKEGIGAATDADRKRWLLPGTSKDTIKRAYLKKSRLKEKHIKKDYEAVPPGKIFEHWHVPFDIDTDWPKSLKDAASDYRTAWQSKINEVNSCIAANAESEVLFDQPEIVKGVVRVSGPFSVEGVRPEELSLAENGEVFDPTPNQWEQTAQNASAYLDRMIQLIQRDGVTFPNNEHRELEKIEALYESDSALHAEGIWKGGGIEQPCDVAIAFGPQYGAVTAEIVEDLVRASRRYDELVVAGFSFDGAAQEIIQESLNPRLKIHMAHIRPDVSPGMDGLLKDTPNSQLFTVFGQPEIDVRAKKVGNKDEIEVELLGVDIYSPLTGEVHSTGASKVAAWFIDGDYDGRCFCITQAFFPNQKAWGKIAKALGATADLEAFESYNGTVSIPFKPGDYKRIAVKVIDPRGNEVMAIRSLKEAK